MCGNASMAARSIQRERNRNPHEKLTINATDVSVLVQFAISLAQITRR
jgi:hypothetical protein